MHHIGIILKYKDTITKQYNKWTEEDEKNLKNIIKPVKVLINKNNCKNLRDKFLNIENAVSYDPIDDTMIIDAFKYIEKLCLDVIPEE